MNSPVAIAAQGGIPARACAEDWSVIYGHTLAVRKIWPSIWTVPTIEDPLALLEARLRGGGTLLEVGASNTSAVRKKLEQSAPHIRYQSFDIDRRTRQDFYSWAEMEQPFEAMVCFEVIEHLPLPTGIELCGQALAHLKPGGVFVIGTPNIFNPTRYLQDPTHITPWCYDRLAGVMLALGFDICAIHRLRDFPPTGGRWRTRLLRAVATKLRPHLGLDFANSIFVVAQRPA